MTVCLNQAEGYAQGSEILARRAGKYEHCVRLAAQFHTTWLVVWEVIGLTRVQGMSLPHGELGQRIAAAWDAEDAEH